MYVLEDSVEMTDLADAIRAKTGSAGDLTVADMITEVGGISGGGNLTYVELNTSNSSNANSSNTSTVITMPTELQGGNRDFFLFICGLGTGGNTVWYQTKFFSATNGWTSLSIGSYGQSGVSGLSLGWNVGRTQITATVSGSNNVWRYKSSGTGHGYIVY